MVEGPLGCTGGVRNLKRIRILILISESDSDSDSESEPDSESGSESVSGSESGSGADLIRTLEQDNTSLTVQLLVVDRCSRGNAISKVDSVDQC
jgi:hypothetical protein